MIYDSTHTTLIDLWFHPYHVLTLIKVTNLIVICKVKIGSAEIAELQMDNIISNVRQCYGPTNKQLGLYMRSTYPQIMTLHMIVKMCWTMFYVLSVDLPVPEDGPELPSQAHLHQHVHVLLVLKRLVQPASVITIFYITCMGIWSNFVHAKHR